jgi:3-phenylpropionate/cinnamic acid dioxygenase small subunit
VRGAHRHRRSCHFIEGITVNSERAIENLLYTYAECIDDGNLDGVAALFDHGRIVRASGAPAAVGRDNVRQMYQTRLYEDGTPRTKHVTTNAIIEVDDEAGTGSSRSYFTVFQQTDELPLQPIITGRYHDTFHCLDGTWWFDSRTMVIDQVGDVSQHLSPDRAAGVVRAASR